MLVVGKVWRCVRVLHGAGGGDWLGALAGKRGQRGTCCTVLAVGKVWRRGCCRVLGAGKIWRPLPRWRAAAAGMGGA